MAPRWSAQQHYRKHFTPLESNPSVFTSLIHKLGVTNSLCFEDVLSLDDPDLLAFLPRPALALILVFPDTEEYQARIQKEDERRTESHDGNVKFFRQTINNACGLYAILHAVGNGASESIAPRSVMARIDQASQTMGVEACALAIENDDELESIYAEIAPTGDTQAPEDPEEDVDFHYICFVKSPNDGYLYHLDGMRKGAVKLQKLADDEDVLSDGCLTVVRQMVDKAQGDLNFSLMALVST